jgi:hypothetical protein
LLQIKARKAQFSQALLLAYVSLQTSAVAKPKIYFLQAGFFTLAFVLTSSIAFSSVFFMPGLVFNGVLTG